MRLYITNEKVETEEFETSFKLREYLNLPSLTKKEMDFGYFNDLANIYRTYLNSNNLTYLEKQDMDKIFEKMLALMLHFFTKTVNQMLPENTGCISFEDFDSVIALTLLQCLYQFDPTKGSFGNYCTSAIKQQLRKEIKRGVPFHLKATDILSGDTADSLNRLVVPILNFQETKSDAEKSYQNRIDQEVSIAMSVASGKKNTDIQNMYETGEMNRFLCDEIRKMKDGKLLTPFGIRDLLDAVQDYAGEELRREIEEYIETNVQDTDDYEKEYNRMEQENERLAAHQRSVLCNIRDEVDALDTLLQNTRLNRRRMQGAVRIIQQMINREL